MLQKQGFHCCPFQKLAFIWLENLNLFEKGQQSGQLLSFISFNFQGKGSCTIGTLEVIGCLIVRTLYKLSWISLVSILFGAYDHTPHGPKRISKFFIVFNLMLQFEIQKRSHCWLFRYTSVACVIGPSVTTSSTDFPFKTWFFGIHLNFQRRKSLKIQYLPHSESKSYQINSIKSCSSRSFQ